MSLIDFTIPNLYNGVSQQPVTIRLPNQMEEQINGFSSVTNGLSKRNGASLIRRTRLDQGNPAFPTNLIRANCMVKTLIGIDSLGAEVTYQLIISTDYGRAWINRLTIPKSTSYIGQFNYLIGSPKNMKIINDGNELYILNKDITIIGTDTDANTFKNQGSIINVYSGSFSNDYTVEVRIKDSAGAYVGSPISVTHVILSSSSPGITGDVLKSSTIAADLVSKLNTAFGGGGLVASKGVSNESWIQVKYSSPSSNTIELKAFTSNAKNSIFAINGVVKDYLQLPNGPGGYNVLVDSDTTDTKDNYYLTYSVAQNTWIEEAKIGLSITVDTTTMPINIKDALLPVGGLGYTKRLGVSNRTSGDSDSNPLPSFFGKKIRDIFLFNNRFGILAGSNVIMSRIDEYETFFRTSNATILGSDRIDLKASLPSSRGTELKFAIPYDNEIIITSDTAQYSLKSNAAFDPKTASLSTLTEYNIDSDCTPINIGTSIYMASKRSNASSILDFSRRADVGMLAEDITEHIPSYLKGRIKDMTTSTVQGVMFLRTEYVKTDSLTGNLIESTDNTIFVQNRFIRNASLIQNAWHKWVFPNEDILGIDIISNRLYVSTTSNYAVDGFDNFKDLYTYVVDFAVNELGTTQDLQTINFVPHLDGLASLTRTQMADMDLDIFTFDPLLVTSKYFINFSNSSRVVMVTNKGQIIRGWENINDFVFDEIVPDATISPNATYYLGFEFDHSFTFSEQVVATYENGEKQVNQHASMILRNMKICFKNSGKFDVTVTPKGRNSFVQNFSGQILGDPSATLGKINISTGTFKFVIGTKPDVVKITVNSNYPFPTSFNTAEWQASVIQRSGRL